MIDREAVAPLIIGLIVALLVHLTLVPAAAVALMSREPEERQIEPEEEEQEPQEEEEQEQEEEKEQPQPPDPDKIKLGKEESQETARVAWISHDAFEKLMTDEASETLQPALQDVVQPVEQAPTPMDPTPATLAAATAAQAQPTPPVTMPQPPQPTEANEQEQEEPEQLETAEAPEEIEDAQPAQQDESAPLPIEPAPSETTVELAKAEAEELTAQNLVDATGPQADRTPTRTEETKPQEEKEEKKDQPPEPVQLVKPSPAVQPAASNPTAAALGRTRIMPTTRVDMRRRRIGGVDVAKGLEVLPANPRFNVVSRISVVPRNAKAEITFDQNGKVETARLTRSTGYAGYDSPILESLYRWQAKGELLKKSEKVVIPVDLILR